MTTSWTLSNAKNHLLIELIGKQDCMTSAIEEVKHDLKETRTHVNKLMEVQQNKAEDTGKKQKRKYPSSVTVCILNNDYCTIIYIII